jgi:teichuronic acid biosynthesis glycosyltransferase TuaG
MKKNNLVSIVIPFFKKEKFFLSAYNSALNQSYRNIEIIIICDDPSLYAANFLKRNTKKYKTKIFFNKKNFGVGKSRNIGIKKSLGDYIAFLDADDLWKKNKLECQLNWMKKKKLDISHTSYNIIDDKNNKIGSHFAPHLLNHKELLCCCNIGTSSVICKKKIFRKIKFPSLSTQEDYVVWLKISKLMKIYALNIKLSSWRNSKQSISKNIFRKIFNAYLVYYKFNGEKVFYSLYRLIILIYYNLKKKNFF